MTTNTRHRRTVFDLTPQELKQLHQLNLNVSATVPPRRPRMAGSYANYHDRHFDEGIHARYQEMHARAKLLRSEWLRLYQISHKVVMQAIQTRYNPYAHAARLGLSAPPVPEGYADALRQWRELKPRAIASSTSAPWTESPFRLSVI